MSEKTAISRKTPPAPLKWLRDQGLLEPPALDYGCGRRTWYGLDGWDPHWYPTPEPKEGYYQTVVCCYVLNVVEEAETKTVLNKLLSCMGPHGVSYVVVRRDLPTTGKQGRGAWQRYVELDPPWRSIMRTSSFEIYEHSV